MHQHANSGYNLFGRNCSSTVSEVLEAGIDDPLLLPITRKLAFGILSTPQQVIKIASILQESFIQPLKLQRIKIWLENISPIEEIISRLSKRAYDLDSQYSWHSQVPFVLALLIVSAIAITFKIALYPIKKVFNFLFNVLTSIYNRFYTIPENQEKTQYKKQLDSKFQQHIDSKLIDINSIDPAKILNDLANCIKHQKIASLSLSSMKIMYILEKTHPDKYRLFILYIEETQKLIFKNQYSALNSLTLTSEPTQTENNQEPAINYQQKSRQETVNPLLDEFTPSKRFTPKTNESNGQSDESNLTADELLIGITAPCA